MKYLRNYIYKITMILAFLCISCHRIYYFLKLPNLQITEPLQKYIRSKLTLYIEYIRAFLLLAQNFTI